MSAEPQRGFFKAFGPGLIFAGAAIGVSHLVQSTRAGAVFGLGMLLFIVLANLLKYPAFRFGPHYASATGTSLLEGYRRQGTWALVAYALVTLGTMFSVLAAVTVVTASLVKVTLRLELGVVPISGLLMALCAGLLVLGHYRWLDRITKVLVAVLTVSTIVAALSVLPRIQWTGALWPAQFDLTTVMFLAALVGWMPSAIDISVWHSLWTLAKNDDSRQRASLSSSMLDFHLGYVGTAFLAVCFMLLGAGVMHGAGIEPDLRPAAFAAQVIDLYKSTLGPWAGPVIGSAAVAVMFSTTLTVVDGFPRAIATLVQRFRGPEVAGAGELASQITRRSYWLAMAVLCAGALLLLATLLDSLPAFVDVATTLSFLTAPLLAVLNHRAIMSPEVPPEARPPRWLWTLSWVGIVALSGFAVLYVFLLVTR
jgi:Mn2+/Fe2+ NRAMP family transporter